MAKIKLTKGELKRQRDGLAQFRRYLPTLQLKKQQLQTKVLEARGRLRQVEDKLHASEHDILTWAGLIADPDIWQTDAQQTLVFDLKQYVLPKDIVLGQANVAGAYVPVLQDVIFADMDYDLYETPFWVDGAIEEMRVLVRLVVEEKVIHEEIRRLQQELRTTTQRVNLFEKIKIPEALDSIRKITIYLGDQQASAVGISKVAKKKIELAAVGS